MLAEMAKKHSSEVFYPLDHPLEAAVFSVLVEMIKDLDMPGYFRPDLFQGSQSYIFSKHSIIYEGDKICLIT